jgi:hypothetical protein
MRPLERQADFRKRASWFARGGRFRGEVKLSRVLEWVIEAHVAADLSLLPLSHVRATMPIPWARRGESQDTTVDFGS